MTSSVGHRASTPRRSHERWTRQTSPRSLPSWCGRRYREGRVNRCIRWDGWTSRGSTGCSPSTLAGGRTCSSPSRPRGDRLLGFHRWLLLWWTRVASTAALAESDAAVETAVQRSAADNGAIEQHLPEGGAGEGRGDLRDDPDVAVRGRNQRRALGGIK